MPTVLITGAHGFLGRYSSLMFKKNNWRVIGIGHGHWGFEQPANYGIDNWIEADIDFYTLVKINEKLDCVVHCAGGSSVGYSLRYPLQDFNKTVTASINLLEYIRIHQPQAQIIYPSSAAVYGKKENTPISETDTLCPISPYGFHKKVVEELFASYSINFALSTRIIRFFSVYGAGLKKQLLWDACNRIDISTKREIHFFGTGQETRDWLHVKDAANLIFKMANTPAPDTIVINGGTGRRRTNQQILNYLSTQIKDDTIVVFNNKSREGDPKHYWADISTAETYNWHPKINIEDGLKEYALWFKQQKR